MPWSVRIMLAGARVQASRARGGFFLLAAVVTPVAYAVVFILMARHLGRATELAPYVVIVPALIGVWYSAIATGAAVVGDERASGTLELLVAAPAPAALVILGRVTANTVLSLISIPFVLVAARLLGAELRIPEPFMAALALLALAVTTVAVTLIFASTFVLARSTAVVQNLIPFPLYILSGIAFPLTLLPEWLHPLSALVPLTWVADLLRSSAQSGGDPAALPKLGALAALSLFYAASGFWLFSRIERAVRTNGKVSLMQ